MGLDLLIKISYQNAKKIVTKMDKLECEDIIVELKEVLESLYSKVSEFGNDTYGCLYNKANKTTSVYIKDVALTQKEYQLTMGRIKKLEIFYSFLFDRINETDFSGLKRVGKC